MHVLLIYFVIFHFMKQQYGFLRYFSRDEYRAHPRLRHWEDGYFYLGVLAPVVSWHVQAPTALLGMYWTQYFLRADWLAPLSQWLWYGYGLAAAGYWFIQWRYVWCGGSVPLPKYLVLLLAHLGWGALSLFPDKGMLFWLGVVLYHDLSYFMFIWLIARRDHRLQQLPRPRWFSWKSWPGALGYVFLVCLLADLLIHAHLSLVAGSYKKGFHALLLPAGVIETLTGWYQTMLGAFESQLLFLVGWALFFSIQAHHYFIDRYLWKREKDWAWVQRAQATKKPPAGLAS